jgi:eukaryotic-like serine/threonine-protein kinase
MATVWPSRPAGVATIADRYVAGRLADFDIALSAGSECAYPDQRPLAAGTARYLAPEQVLGRPATSASDVYSFGLVLLEMSTGQRPFVDSADGALARLRRPVPVPSDLSGGWYRLLKAMTEREPSRRPTSAEVALRLNSLPLF